MKKLLGDRWFEQVDEVITEKSVENENEVNGEELSQDMALDTETIEE
jgi:hypothetical protein